MFARPRLRLKDGRRLTAAWLAVVALLVQALLPSAALAASGIGVRQVEICNGKGGDSVVVGRDGAPVAPFAGLPCLDCLAAAAATALAAPAPTVAPAGHALVLRLAPGRDAARPPPARAPPRPPGQGPPAAIA